MSSDVLTGSAVALTVAPSWRDRAACRGMGPETWFSTDARDVAVALAVCRACPVRRSCLDAAMAEETSGRQRDGVRGGMTPGARARASTRRRHALRALTTPAPAPSG